MTAPAVTPPKSPNAMLLIKLPPLRLFTSSNLTFEKPVASALPCLLTTIESGETEMSLPCTSEFAGEATLKRIVSPALSEAIS
jgi:1-deoxy-D-xylulose 5-phosphate reductoisomerase